MPEPKRVLSAAELAAERVERERVLRRGLESGLLVLQQPAQPAPPRNATQTSIAEFCEQGEEIARQRQ